MKHKYKKLPPTEGVRRIVGRSVFGKNQRQLQTLTVRHDGEEVAIESSTHNQERRSGVWYENTMGHVMQLTVSEAQVLKQMLATFLADF